MKTSSLLVLLAAILVVALAPAACAQRRPATPKPTAATSYKLTSLKVTGTTRYTDREILAASGLELGQSAAEGDFKEAVQRLGESGLFIAVAYSYSYSGSGVKVEFQLTDSDQSKFVPVDFENFVWFTDSELRKELLARVPLFKGDVPVSGTFPDKLLAALQTLLDIKQIPGRVDYLRQAPQEGGKFTGISYSVQALDVRIRNVEFTGATPELLPGLEAAGNRLADAIYARTSLAKVAEIDFLPVCLKHGYLKAKIATVEARVVSQENANVEVDAVFPITPGLVYSTSGVEWKGNAAVSTSELGPTIHLPTGQPADAIRLARDLENDVKLYRGRGYMTARIKPVAELDDAKAAVRYTLDVAEGDVYKMGELDLLGLDTASHDRLREAWKLRQGDTYNADYLRTFLNDTHSLLPRGADYAVKIDEEVRPKDKTVDVTIHFRMR